MDTLIYRAGIGDPDLIIRAVIVDMLIKENLAFHEIMASNKESAIKTVAKKLIEEKALIYNNEYILNRTNKKIVNILTILGYSKSNLNISNLTVKFNELFRGKRGINKEGFTYQLSEPSKTAQSLQKFVAAYPQYNEAIILQAVKEYFNSAEVRDRCFFYSPKATGFIEGTENSEFLRGFCESVYKRESLQNLNVMEDYYE